MQIEQWPAFGTSGFIAAHQLDGVNPHLVASTVGAASDTHAAVLPLWSAVRHLPDAATMILKSDSRVWVAAGTVLVEAKAGFNIGLLMPSLRGLPVIAAGQAPRITRFADRYQRTIWDIAERLHRVEAVRAMVFRTGADTRRLRASREGFAMLDTDLAGFLAGVKEAISKNTPVSYSLEQIDESDAATPLPPTQLFGDVGEGQVMRLEPDGWPRSVPAGFGMDQLSAVATVVQRLSVSDLGKPERLTVMSSSARQVCVAVPEGELWAVTLSPSGV